MVPKLLSSIVTPIGWFEPDYVLQYLRPAIEEIRRMVRDGVPRAEVERQTGLQFNDAMWALMTQRPKQKPSDQA